MNSENHTEKLRVEVAFPRKDFYGASAIIYMHISVVRFFKTLTTDQIEKYKNAWLKRGNNTSETRPNSAAGCISTRSTVYVHGAVPETHAVSTPNIQNGNT